MSEWEVQQAERRERVRLAIEEGRVTHSRMRRIGGPAICVYERDEKSPTGVSCLAILDDCPATSELLGRRFSALSPTEGF